jgi:hypothetical protein
MRILEPTLYRTKALSAFDAAFTPHYMGMFKMGSAYPTTLSRHRILVNVFMCHTTCGNASEVITEIGTSYNTRRVDRIRQAFATLVESSIARDMPFVDVYFIAAQRCGRKFRVRELISLMMLPQEVRMCEALPHGLKFGVGDLISLTGVSQGTPIQETDDTTLERMLWWLAIPHVGW